MKTKREQSYETLLVLTGALIIFFWIWNKKIFLLLALILVGIGVVSPWLSEKISWLWMKLAELMGAVMSKVLLSAVFYLFLLPLSLLQKLFKKSTLGLSKKEGSYYFERNHTYTRKDLENMW